MSERQRSSDPPVIEPGHTYGSITDKISTIVLSGRTPRRWYVGFAVAFALTMLMLFSITYLLIRGVGVWGVNIPVGWGFAIICFVWWIGIGHAGTLISAILLLFRQSWRTSINRFAEAMTLFAVACAGLFPLLHLGRPWKFFWLLPYPNTMGLWPQFRSPLIWDVFAVTTYALVSLMFWYVGLIPDLASLRDRATRRLPRFAYGVLAMGWRGSARHWQRYQKAYFLLAALATPLVISVHSIVGLDFATSILPGWHVTLFPPYFVAGAIFSGFAMVLTLAIPLRKLYGLEDFVTTRHLDNMAKIVLATGLMVAYGYLMEAFIAWYSGNPYERSIAAARALGPFARVYWVLIGCNVLVPQMLWFRGCRVNQLVLWIVALIVNIGMWLERYIIVVTSLAQDYLPSSWGTYSGTFWDWSLFIGTIGLFFAMMFLFVRFLPMISISEMRELITGHGTSDRENPP